MLFVSNENVTDPHINLAIEEHLLRSLESREQVLLFYINESSIIIGRNQNTLEEINQAYVEEKGIHIVRRLSGGGAVYHDLGNLNFSFITRAGKEHASDFVRFTAPVIRALNEMGVPAALRGRNDIVVKDRKISGNASYTAASGVVSHGTLLFDTDLSHLTEALKVKPGKIVSKGIKSIRSRVANITEYLPEPVDIETFRERLLESIFQEEAGIPQYRLSTSDWDAIHRLVDERYRTWEWNYGRSPDFNVQKTQRFPGGEIDARIDVSAGLVRGIKFYGDFFGQSEVSELEQILVGARYERRSLAEHLQAVDASQYFGGMTNQELVEFLSSTGEG